MQDIQDDNMQHVERLKMYTTAPTRSISGPFPDHRIKVAIIDNGADRIRSRIGEMIAKGVSYVTADLLGSDRILPWWMVSDAHGTQMASLIGQTNPYCRLYIAHVGKGRKDILTKNSTKVSTHLPGLFLYSFSHQVQEFLVYMPNTVSLTFRVRVDRLSSGPSNKRSTSYS